MCELFLSYIYYMYMCVCMFQVVRELARKRAGEKIPALLNVHHGALQGRVEELRKWRLQHEELRNVIQTVLAPTHAAASTDVRVCVCVCVVQVAVAA